eukprot:TRINITY_DN1395_c1_g1_i4.p1 TRINITY_DN1395_c1_g1~~TRINITY_DN1395_c1_g1_i4.p1  ORF type:complete len:709 (-),score=81.97 TRINITY_DN1395_c1_g1_i4:10-2136(-)
MDCACQTIDADGEHRSRDTIGLCACEGLLKLDKRMRSCHEELIVRLDWQDQQLSKLFDQRQTQPWSLLSDVGCSDRGWTAQSQRIPECSEYVGYLQSESRDGEVTEKRACGGSTVSDADGFVVDEIVSRSTVAQRLSTTSRSMTPSSETQKLIRQHPEEPVEWLMDFDEIRDEASDKIKRHHSFGPREEDAPSKVKQLVTNFYFEAFFCCTICVNGLFIGMEVQWQAENMTEDTTQGFKIVGDAFAMVFLIELLIRIVAEPFNFFFACSRDFSALLWNYFDTFLVAASLVEFSLNAFTPTGFDKPSVSNLRIVRVMRITRLCRLLRIARILRFIKGFRILVISIIYTFRGLSWAMVLLFVIIYVFAIAFTQGTNSFLVSRIRTENLEGNAWQQDESMLSLWHYCGTMPRSIYTLFMISSEGRSWGDVGRPISTMSTVWLLLLMVFIAVIHFAVLNVVTGVFCQSAIDSARRDREMAIQSLLENKQTHVKNIRNQFKTLFDNIDSDSSGHISIAEFKEHINDEKLNGFFVLLDIDTSDTYALFKLLDDDGSGAIDAEEFVDGCLRLQGVARSIDLAKVRHEHKAIFKKLATHLANADKRSRSAMKAMDSNLKALQRQVSTILSLIAIVLRKQQDAVEVGSSDVLKKSPSQLLPSVPGSSPRIDSADTSEGALVREIPLEPPLRTSAVPCSHLGSGNVSFGSRTVTKSRR